MEWKQSLENPQTTSFITLTTQTVFGTTQYYFNGFYLTRDINKQKVGKSNGLGDRKGPILESTKEVERKISEKCYLPSKGKKQTIKQNQMEE